MAKRSLIILGATGSIGDSTFKVIDNNPEAFEVKTLVAFGHNLKKLAQRAVKHGAETVAIYDQNCHKELENNIDYFYSQYKNSVTNLTKPKVVSGQDAVLEAVKESNYNICISAITGIAGLVPTLSAIPHCKVLALANKESIVCAGDIILNCAAQHHTKIIPIDSEHNAIYRILLNQEGSINLENVCRIILTASGGPFWEYSHEQMAGITPAMALKHPTWSMGAKISVDSATMMNKGLEIIEAAKLFDVPMSKIAVLIHRQSIVHGIVEYNDGTTMLCASQNDMSIPIEGAMLSQYHQTSSRTKKAHIDFGHLYNLTFEPEDTNRFPLLQLARDAYATNSSAIIAMNAANEVAVQLFLSGKIKFLDIADIVIGMTDRAITANIGAIKSIEEVLEYDREVRLETIEMIKI